MLNTKRTLSEYANDLGDALLLLATRLEKEEKAKKAKEQAEGERMWRAQRTKRQEQASAMPYQIKAFLW